MTKNNNIFSELMSEAGFKPSQFIWIAILNFIRILSVFAVAVLVVAWIVTQDHSFGWALIWPAAAFVLSTIAGFVFGLRMMFK